MFRTIPVLALLAACTGTAETPATSVMGRAESPDSGSTDGEVQASRVDAGGSLIAASEGSVAITDGRYQIGLDGAAASALVVEATFDDGTRGAAVVAGASASGAVVAPPMDAETTAEADIYVQLEASGDGSDDESCATLRAFVSADATVSWTTLADEARDDFALGVAAAVSAWEAGGATANAAAVEALASATVAADASADASGEARTDAEARASLIASWEAAGASADDLAFMAAAAMHAQVAASGGTDAETDHLDVLRAELAARVVTDAGAEMGGGLDVGALVEVAAGGDADATVALLSATLDADQVAALTVQSEVAAQASAELDAEVAAAAAEGARACGERTFQAVAAFRQTVEGDVAADLEASGAFDSGEAHAVARVLAQAWVTGS